MSDDQTDTIVSGLIRLLADGMVFAMRTRLLRMRASALNLDIAPHVWDNGDIDQICERIADAIGRAGGEVPFDPAGLIEISSFEQPHNKNDLRSEADILAQHQSDRQLIIDNSLFLFSIFDHLAEAPTKDLVTRLITHHSAKLQK